jgi:signal recognition particle subunit SRP54
MGDVVSLVEKAATGIEAEKAQAMAAKLRKGAFDLDDLSDQLRQMQKLGGMSGVMGMLPGIGKMKKQLAGMDIDDGLLKRQQAIISSMTKAERKNPKLLNASRKKRVASGSGSSVPEINRLVKMHRQMADMMKQMGRGKGMLGRMFGAGGPPPEAPPEGAGGGQAPQLPPGFGQGALPRLPGLGQGGAPRGLPGLPGFRKK